jgi:hypothetical protein
MLACGRRPKGRMSELRPLPRVIATAGNHLPPDAWGLGGPRRPEGMGGLLTFPAAAAG